ncbi:DNA adenine methylase [Nocardioides aequoreus]|uniref:DNA adenine methylase n=1 Tax=Nocardioides aequoreus TaxID=397278 RepID=UPI0012F6259C|nr:DNA adenine methylase [Nocardioides aequoreus]
MGSKAALLRGELGRRLLAQANRSERFVDLFAGSGSVAHYVAENTDTKVLAVDLQRYSAHLSGAILLRDASIERDTVLRAWKVEADFDAPLFNAQSSVDAAGVSDARRVAPSEAGGGFITRQYGGHYYSIEQARALDSLYEGLPEGGPERFVAEAALIRTASACAAAPGHTAQPFQPTAKLLPYINAAWRRDAFAECARQVEQLSTRYAQVIGQVRVADALVALDDIGPGDLVFCDPPYSDVQYSRFYHVLEGIASGGWDSVSGSGRSPAIDQRASSDFSLKRVALQAMSTLLCNLREKGCQVIVTFPAAEASNGLSAQKIVEMARSRWTVTELYVDSRHSTLGGSGAGRGGRRNLQEAVLVMAPK